MRFELPRTSQELMAYLTPFMEVVGPRWSKRTDQLYSEQRRSPYLWKIVADYHWLEMAISDCTQIRGRHEEVPETHALIQAALRFAAGFVEVRNRASDRARNELDGRLRDGLNGDSGFAALYLEVETALKLMAAGYEVTFSDLEHTGRHDLDFRSGGFVGEVECKSISLDSGRRIRRKDFYRLVASMESMLTAHEREGPGIVVITLKGRLSPNKASFARLREAVGRVLRKDAPRMTGGNGYRVEWRYAGECFDTLRPDQRSMYSLFQEVFGPNVHVAGALSASTCLVVMRSEREDDTSKPWLEAMRKAATQLSGDRPGFIVVQLNDVSIEDLLLHHLRRRAGILSHGLFDHYGADHVNAIQVCGYGALVSGKEEFGAPAFGVRNPKPKYSVDSSLAAPFLKGISDEEFADALGVPRPGIDVSNISL